MRLRFSVILVTWAALSSVSAENPVDPQSLPDYWPLQSSETIILEYYYRIGPFRMDFQSPTIVFDFFSLVDDGVSTAFKTKDALRISSKKVDASTEIKVEAATPMLMPDSIRLTVGYKLNAMPSGSSLSWSIETVGGSEQNSQSATITLFPDQEKVEVSVSSLGLGSRSTDCELARGAMDGTLHIDYSEAARQVVIILNDLCIARLPVEFFDPYRIVMRGWLPPESEGFDVLITGIDSDRIWTHSRTELKEQLQIVDRTGSETIFRKISQDASREDWFIKSITERRTTISLLKTVYLQPSGYSIVSEYEPPLEFLRWPAPSGERWTSYSTMTVGANDSEPVMYEGEVIADDADVDSFRERHLGCLVIDGIFQYPKMNVHNRYYFAPNLGLVKQEQFQQNVDYLVVELKDSTSIQTLPIPYMQGRIDGIPHQQSIKIVLDARRQEQSSALLILWIEANGVAFFWNGTTFVTDLVSLPIDLESNGRSQLLEINQPILHQPSDDIELTANAVFLDPENPSRVSKIAAVRLSEVCPDPITPEDKAYGGSISEHWFMKILDALKP